MDSRVNWLVPSKLDERCLTVTVNNGVIHRSVHSMMQFDRVNDMN